MDARYWLKPRSFTGINDIVTNWVDSTDDEEFAKASFGDSVGELSLIISAAPFQINLLKFVARPVTLPECSLAET